MNLKAYKTSKNSFYSEKIRKNGMETSLTNIKTNDKGSTRDSVMQKRQ